MPSPQPNAFEDCLIRVENVSKIYSLDTSGGASASVNSQVLFDVNLVIPRGQFVAIMGHSGFRKIHPDEYSGLS